MFDHYIALDWAQNNMAVARLTGKGKKLSTFEGRADIADLKAYVSSLAGRKILTLEESSTAQWLYVELRDSVDQILICDPRRNRLLSEGAKNDKIDATKLVKLLKADMLKEVYHSAEEFIYLRKIVSGYQDVIRAGVRLKNQRSALFRANGLNHKDPDAALAGSADNFVLAGLNQAVENYETERKRYKEEISRLCKKHKLLKVLKTLPGIDEIGAIKIASRVVNPKRFLTKGSFLSFCGLVHHEKISGGRSYGKNRTNYSRELKNVFDTAAASCISAGENNFLKQRYEYLRTEKRYPDHNARKAIARHAAVLAWGVMKSGVSFDRNRRRFETLKT